MTVMRSAIADLSVPHGTERGWHLHPVRTAANGVLLASGIIFGSRAASLQSRVPHPQASLVPMLAASSALMGYAFAQAAFSRTEKWERAR